MKQLSLKLMIGSDDHVMNEWNKVEGSEGEKKGSERDRSLREKMRRT